MTEARVILKPRHVKPIALRHPWVFASAVERVEGGCENGDVVTVHDPAGRFLGRGFLSVNSEMRVRMMSWDKDQEIDEEFLRRRVEQAIGFRREGLRLTTRTNAYRLVNGEGDGLPGLVVDVYGEVCVAQFTTFGMARRASVMGEILREAAQVSGVYEKADGTAQRREGFIRPSGALCGEVAEGEVEVWEGTARFVVDVRQGQKTGFYLDQRDNRQRAAELAPGKRALDAFTYTGGFAVQMALAGAASVTAVESSGPALSAARRNTQLNGLASIEFRQGDVFETLRLLRVEGRTFDLAVVDPPKMAHSRAGLRKAMKGYKDVNLSAMRILSPNGWLVTCSCSGLVGREEFLATLNEAATDAGRRVRVVSVTGQAPDHVTALNCPEGNYLKCVIASVE